MSDVRNPKIKAKGKSVSVDSSQDDKFKTFLKVTLSGFLGKYLTAQMIVEWQNKWKIPGNRERQI